MQTRTHHVRTPQLLRSCPTSHLCTSQQWTCRAQCSASFHILGDCAQRRQSQSQNTTATGGNVRAKGRCLSDAVTQYTSSSHKCTTRPTATPLLTFTTPVSAVTWPALFSKRISMGLSQSILLDTSHPSQWSCSNKECQAPKEFTFMVDE